jgi:hypothetical protein
MHFAERFVRLGQSEVLFDRRRIHAAPARPGEISEIGQVAVAAAYRMIVFEHFANTD